MLATLAVVLWLLPTVIAKTPMFPWILNIATADLNGSVTVKSASLGWLSPIEVHDIEVKDKGQDRARGGFGRRRPPAGSDPLQLFQPRQVHLKDTKPSVVMRDDGTNVEDMLAKYLAPKEKPSSTKISLAVEIIDGNMSVTDVLTGLVCQVQKLSVKFDMEGVRERYYGRRGRHRRVATPAARESSARA